MGHDFTYNVQWSLMFNGVSDEKKMSDYKNSDHPPSLLGSWSSSQGVNCHANSPMVIAYQ